MGNKLHYYKDHLGLRNTAQSQKSISNKLSQIMFRTMQNILFFHYRKVSWTTVACIQMSTIPLMKAAVIQYLQQLCSNVMSSFLDSGKTQTLNCKNGLWEDFTKQIKIIELSKTRGLSCVWYSSQSLQQDLLHVH